MTKSILGRILLLIFILVSGIVVLMPFVWMVSVSFRPDSEIMKFPPSLFSGKFTLSTYTEFFEKVKFFRIFFNTVFVASVITIAGTITSALAGFGFAKYDFRGKNVIFLGLMATIMIPIFVILIPLYMVMLKLNWLDSYNALIIPFLATPFGIFLMRQFIFAIPDELIYAARIDGCTEYGIFFRIILPAVKPAMASLLIILFMQQWDSLLWPIIVTTATKFRTIPVALTVLSHENNTSTNWNLTMVGTVLSTLPIVITFLFMQRYFISSITMTGIKD